MFYNRSGRLRQLRFAEKQICRIHVSWLKIGEIVCILQHGLTVQSQKNLIFLRQRHRVPPVGAFPCAGQHRQQHAVIHICIIAVQHLDRSGILRFLEIIRFFLNKRIFYAAFVHDPFCDEVPICQQARHGQDSQNQNHNQNDNQHLFHCISPSSKGLPHSGQNRPVFPVCPHEQVQLPSGAGWFWPLFWEYASLAMS